MLKRFFVYILLFAMSLRPAYFVGVVTYYETHINEIVEKYCVNKGEPELQCNGQCHLSKQITATNTQQSGEDATFEISCAFFPVFFQQVPDTDASVFVLDKQNDNFFYKDSYQFSLNESSFEPPQFI